LACGDPRACTDLSGQTFADHARARRVQHEQEQFAHVFDDQVRGDGRERAVQRGHDLAQPEHDHDDPNDVVRPLEQHFGRVRPVHVFDERAQFVVDVAQPGQRRSGGGRRTAGDVGHLDQIVDALEAAVQHVVLDEHQHVDDHLAHTAGPVRDDDDGRHHGHVENGERQVGGHGRDRVEPEHAGQTPRRRRATRLIQEPKRAFGAGQPGALVPPSVEHRTNDVRRRPEVPVEQLDQRETVRLLEARPQRPVHVPYAFHVVVVHDERVQARVERPYRYQSSV